MKRSSRTRLSLERLEHRDCPAMGLSFQNGTLTLTGSPVGQVDVKVGASNAVQVTDNAGAINFGIYRVTNGLKLTLRSHPDVINVNLQGNTFTGNVTIDLGLGDPSRQCLWRHPQRLPDHSKRQRRREPGDRPSGGSGDPGDCDGQCDSDRHQRPGGRGKLIRRSGFDDQ